MSLRNPEWLAPDAKPPMMCVKGWRHGHIMDCLILHCGGCMFYPVIKRSNEAKRKLREEEAGNGKAAGL